MSSKYFFNQDLFFKFRVYKDAHEVRKQKAKLKLDNLFCKLNQYNSVYKKIGSYKFL